MEKKLNKMEGINEEVKVEEISEETLENVNGGKFGDANEFLCNTGIAIGTFGAYTGNLPVLGAGVLIGLAGLIF